MKKTDYCNALSKTFISGTVFTVAVLTGCGRDEDPVNEESGDPYKFRIEISCEHPELYNVGISLGSYNYVENGLPRTGWLSDPDNFVEELPSPLVKEYEIPGNFTKFFIDAGVFAKGIVLHEKLLNEGISGKLTVNNRIIASSSAKFGWVCNIVYNAAKKKYVIKYSDGNDVELDKLN
ncbi:MAG: hypothetical protein LBJ72_10360 [Dysgonamonadaceae bacterium]|jgi:hypothetical protein|nr:hypothetical protein [Dysgonamonadaceae bacterium]